MPRSRFPVDPWRLVETQHDPDDLGVTETLFAVANGYLGMRGNPEEGRDAYAHGTFVNGFHETWPIRHAEAAFGFARTGQTIVNVPDAKLMKLYVDDEPLNLSIADLEHYERSLDFRDGILRRSVIWRTPSGKRVQVDSTRMVSMTQRHLAVHDPRGHDAGGRRPDRHLLPAAQPPGRQGRVPRPQPVHGRGDRPSQGGGVRGPGARAAAALRPRGPDAAGLPVRQLADDDRGRRRPPDRHRGRRRDDPARGRGPHQDGLPGRGDPGQHHPTGEDGGLPLLARRPGQGALRPLRPHPRPGRRTTTSTTTTHEQREWFDEFWASSRRADQRRRGHARARRARGPAGDPLQPVQPRPGQRARRPAGRRRQGRHRVGLRGPLLLGLRDLRRPVPHLHDAGRRPEPAALPQPDAAGRPAPRPRDGAERRALPLAHDQRRGGLGLLRRRHRAGAHRRRRRLRPGAVRRRDR